MARRPTAPIRDLTGKLLVATPVISDRAFERAVIFVCAHSSQGTLGLIVNRGAEGMTLRRLLVENGMQPVPPRIGIPIHVGGPSRIDHIAMLHRPIRPSFGRTTRVSDTVCVTPGIEFVRHLMSNHLLTPSFIALGHCAWKPGQIEEELESGLWLAADAQCMDVFETPLDRRWDEAMGAIGVTLAAFSTVEGHA